MLNTFRLLQNVGQFDSVSSGANLPLARLALGYAENGRGKTTLSAIVRSLAANDPLLIRERHRLGATHPPRIIIDCAGGPPHAMFENGAWNRHVPQIAIFDDAFVDQNICSGLAIDAAHRQHLHEFILGSQGVALNQAVQTQIDTIETLTRSLRDLGNAIPETARFGVLVETFCALPENARVDNDIRDVERAIAATGKQAAIQATSELTDYQLPAVPVDEIEQLLAAGIEAVDQAATNKVQAHCEMIGPGGERWIAEGVGRVQGGLENPAGKPCPFCVQDLGGSSIVGHYRAYFAMAYEAHKASIEQAYEAFHRRFDAEAQVYYDRERQVEDDRRIFWSEFTQIADVGFDADGIHNAWTNMRQAVLRELDAKAAAPPERMQLSAETRITIAAYQQKAEEVRATSAMLLEANAAIRLVKEQAASANAAALQSDLTRLRATKSRHSPEIAPLCAAYLDEQNRKIAAETARDAARAVLNQYRTTIFPTYQAAINDCLRRFNAGFRLDSVTSNNTRGGSSCTYNVLINNKTVAVSAANPPAGSPAFKSTLSAGDRNTLALAIFFASLEQDANLATKIVVIDDPVSSLDDHRTLSTVHEICALAQRVSQVVVLSHSKPFLCALWEGTDATLRSAFTFERAINGSTLRAWDVNQDLITDHDRRHALLRNYVDAAQGDRREVAEALRPTLEAFMRVVYPQHFPPGSLLGPFRGLCEQRVGTPNEIMNQADIDELRRLTDYGNRFHHDSNPAYRTQAINDAELLDFTRRTLAFAKR
ncbi:UNVERIFIED_ORG: wobble nucleotide-excising tRNase [Bradyrhizobium japonicum]|uniref:AAA family ATPase n=1 Tax=Bradyrhizobium diazoefficiens TaxID=1355477 RepID=UPI003497C358